MVFKDGSRPRGIVNVLLLGKLGAHFFNLRAHDRVLTASRGEVLLEGIDVLDRPAERLPLAGLVVLGLR